MDYNKIRKVIANCCTDKWTMNDPIFRLNVHKLSKMLQPYGLVPVIYKNNYISKQVGPEDIPLISEYFKEKKLEWFDKRKTYLTITFIREEDIDDRLEDLLADCVIVREMETNPPKVPCNVKEKNSTHHCMTCPHNRNKQNIDITKVVAEIMGNYPCSTALIAKWVRRKDILMNIRFRANSLLINADKDDTQEPTDPDNQPEENPTTPTDPVTPPSTDDKTDENVEE